MAIQKYWIELNWIELNWIELNWILLQRWTLASNVTRRTTSVKIPCSACRHRKANSVVSFVHPDPIREIRIWIYLPFWPDKVMRVRIYTTESGSSPVFQLFLACYSLIDTKTCYLTRRLVSECLLSIPSAHHLNGFITMLK
jgi:hypothetical protein